MLVDAELEEEGAVLMPEHDTGRDRRVAGVERHDLALAGLGERGRGAPDKSGVAVILDQRGAALSLPAPGFQLQKHLERGGDLLAGPRNVETDGAMFGQPMALAAQLL